MQDGPIEKNVEEQLLNERKRRRKTGEVPYPLDYSFAMLNFDNWDHMFLKSCCQSLTVHQFDKPPAVVLDLGCGGGYWTIEAAKQWKESTIIGFDLKKIQPKTSLLGSLKVRWVHGNLLDGLPFDSDHFDFVRIAGIGLGVPEDEWQYLLEEVARVMKPGAILEMIEEDLIFPCGQRPLRISTEVSHGGPISPRSPSSLTLSDGWPSQDHSSSSILPNSPEATSPDVTTWSTYLSSSSTFTLSQARSSDFDEHPRDHTRLKAAWDGMLSKRFLAAQLVTVLPFYLSSAFVDVRTQLSVQIPLPPNSIPDKKRGLYASARNNNSGQISIDLDVHSDLKMSPGKATAAEASGGSRTPSQLKFPRRVPTCASMHLAKTVQTVVECKESIWVEYEKLYSSSVPQITRTVRGNDSAPLFSHHHTAREDFERSWSNWENDMMDRIGMRDCMASVCSWPEPQVGDQPGWRVWRDSLESNWKTEKPSSPQGTAGLCRSLRAFVGWKPS